MEDELMHELVAGYALEALEPEEERAFETHLRGCERCREQLAAFAEPTAALAFAAPPAAPPPALRARILAAARDERPNVVPLRPRWAVPAAVAAAVASSAAVGLGVWAGILQSQSHTGRQALATVALRGASGSLVLSSGGAAALVVSGLPPTPAGKTYEAWVVLSRTALPAGLFTTATGAASVRLSRPVPAGAQVALTLEPAGGSPAPTSRPLVTSARA